MSEAAAYSVLVNAVVLIFFEFVSWVKQNSDFINTSNLGKNKSLKNADSD